MMDFDDVMVDMELGSWAKKNCLLLFGPRLLEKVKKHVHSSITYFNPSLPPSRTPSYAHWSS